MIDTWQQGRTPFGGTEWTVSMEWALAPEDLRICLDAGGMIAVVRNFLQTDASPGAEPRPGTEPRPGPGITTLFLNGGLNGRLFYFGVALTPLARESHARVGRVMASADTASVALAAVGDAVTGFCEKLKLEN